MKRRPQRLQVSTFPFLAVLLCAMGSLILVLLVMDRRAKLVARAKAMQAVVAEERRQEARRAEWERRRQELHARLAQQDDEVRRQMQAILGRIEAALAETRSEEERARKLQEQVEAERTALARLEQELAAARAGQTAGGSDPVHAEMARLSAEVDQLERTVAAIKAARQQARQTFSVVPYHGRRGDSRRPIYIECAAAGVIFHPDRLTLPPTEFSRLEIRAEVARRLASLLPSQTPGPSDKEGAYLLLLVRPSGIISYYLTLEALKGLPLAFGYELIEDDWVLDFPRDHDPVNQPWMATARAASLPTAREPGAGTRLNPPRGVAFGAGSAAEGEGALPRRSGAGGDSLSPVGLLEPGQGLGGAALANPYGRPRSSTPATGLVSDQRGVVPSVDRSPPHPQPLSPTGARGEASFPFSPTGARGGALAPASEERREALAPFKGEKGAVVLPSPPAEERGSTLLPSPPVGEKGTTLLPSPPVGERGRGEGANAPALAAGSRLNRAENPALDPAPDARAPAGASSGRGAGSDSAMSRPMSATAAPGTTAAAPREPQPPLPSFSQMIPAGGSRPPTSSSAGGPAAAKEESGNQGGGSGEGAEVGVAGAGPPERGTGKPPPRPIRLSGNRDLIIQVECTAGAVVLHPTRLRIPTTALTPRGDANPLVQAVRQMITRRQASVRPGETPYRPQVRFLVRPDGLRAFHLAYPALEALRLPMTRQDIGWGEEVRTP